MGTLMQIITRFLLTGLSLLPLLASADTTPVTHTLTGLHVDWIDKQVAPTQNFFGFANGNWQKKNPIPAAYATWGTFHQLQDQNQQVIKNILETTAENNPAANSIAQKVGDFYFSGMNEAAINADGVKPLQPEFDRINQMKNIADLQQAITHLQLIGVETLFSFGQMQDFKNSQNVIGVAMQSGLGLPDRDYYLKNDEKFRQIRAAYRQHITKMFELLGDNAKIAKAEAATVMAIETSLAKASMSRIEQRDPHAVYHIKSVAELQQMTKHFSWQQYFTDIGHPEIQSINLATPGFFSAMNTQLQSVPMNDWKTYLRWHLIGSFAPFLSQPFIDQNFRMVAVLSGAKELLPRWKRVISAENEALGFAIGKLYVDKTFPASSKVAVQHIITDIRTALKADLQNLAWMTPETRTAAIKKLDLMEERVGYPDQWRDYSSLKIDRGPYVLNMMRAMVFLNKRELDKIGKPVDRVEWDMTPQTVNAYYDPSMNRLNLPAGILQPPFFDPAAPTAVNYGAIGFVIGHEMTHGFDDQGAQFDGQGNLKSWWGKDDLKKFQAATAAVANQFSQYSIPGNVHVQGKLVMGEAVADLGGLTLAYRAFQHSNTFQTAQTLGGFTPEQQFFLAAAHVWANNIRPEEARRLVIVDPHPPAMYRVNGTFANMPEFQQAFGIGVDSPMFNKERPMIW
jgi:putative endopeptidase